MDRAFLITVGSQWTGFFDNHRYEDLSSSVPYNLTRVLGCETYAFRLNRGRGIQFQAFRPGEPDPIERRVMVYLTSEWQFTEAGDPLPFEDLNAYQRFEKRERLTESMLRAYGRALGIPFWEEESYGQDVVFLDARGAPRLEESTVTKIFVDFAKSIGGKLVRYTRREKGDRRIY